MADCISIYYYKLDNTNYNSLLRASPKEKINKTHIKEDVH